jgi:hypothetical protein
MKTLLKKNLIVCVLVCSLVSLLGVETAHADIFNDANLVGFWQFNGDANDNSGTGNHGTLNGDASVSNEILECDGTGDYVQIADHSTLNPSDELTVAFWVYNEGGQNAGVFKYAACPDQAGSPGNSRAYQLIVFDSNKVAQFSAYSAVTTWDTIKSASTVGTDEWHHLAATFDSGAAAIYIDGQLDNSDTLSVTSLMDDAQPLTIGGMWEYCGADSVEGRLDGAIDDVMIYDAALADWEIRQIYDRTNKARGYYNNITPLPDRVVLYADGAWRDLATW